MFRYDENNKIEVEMRVREFIDSKNWRRFSIVFFIEAVLLFRFYFISLRNSFWWVTIDKPISVDLSEQMVALFLGSWIEVSGSENIISIYVW